MFIKQNGILCNSYEVGNKNLKLSVKHLLFFPEKKNVDNFFSEHLEEDLTG